MQIAIYGLIIALEEPELALRMLHNFLLITALCKLNKNEYLKC